MSSERMKKWTCGLRREEGFGATSQATPCNMSKIGVKTGHCLWGARLAAQSFSSSNCCGAEEEFPAEQSSA